MNFLFFSSGFTRQQVGAYYEAAYKRIRVFGEKHENNRRIRFSVVYIIPENCNGDALKGEFQEGATITITIPKKPKEPEPQPAQEQVQEAAKQVSTPPEEPLKNGEKVVSEQKPKSEMESGQRETDEKKDEKPTTLKAEFTEEAKMLQKDTKQEDQKNDSGDQKMKDSTESSSSITEESKGSESGIPQKDNQDQGKGIPQEDDKNEENQKIASEARKASQLKDQQMVKEESKKLEGKESDLFIAYESSGLNKAPVEKRENEESFQLEREKTKLLEREEYSLDIVGLKKTPVKKEEEEEKRQMDVQTNKVNEERSHGNKVSSESSSSIGKGMMIKDMANSASQAVTRLANKFSEEDKQMKLLCAGAAILVVVVGIYASFKLRSITIQ